MPPSIDNNNNNNDQILNSFLRVYIRLNSFFIKMIEAQLIINLNNNNNNNTTHNDSNSEMKQLKSINLNITNGWNNIDINDLFKIEDHQTNNFVYNYEIKCKNDCIMGFADSDNQYITKYMRNDLLIDFVSAKRPFLSFEMKPSVMTQRNDKEKHQNRFKRDTQQSLRNPNYIASGINQNDYKPKRCFNNYPDSERECCLITYFVNFNALRWSSWILSPSGFVANYCSGQCKKKSSFKYGGNNGELKLRYNEKLLSNNLFGADELLETCCHPVSMDSLVIKYLAGNGSVISTVIPNMIITGCGCS
jgi:hypothetical protein